MLEDGDWGRLEELVRRPRALLETSEDGLTILGLAVWRGDLEAVERLLRAGVDPGGGAASQALRPVLVAVAVGDVAILRRLLRAGAEANARDPGGGTALMAAVAEQDRMAVEALLEAGADPASSDREGRTALQIATEEGLSEIAGLLRDYGASAVPTAGAADLEAAPEDGELLERAVEKQGEGS